MTVGTMRAIDRFAGIPLCWVLGGLVRLQEGFRSRYRAGRNADWMRTGHEKLKDQAEGRKRGWQTVAVIKLFGLGSVLLTSPFLSALRKRLPEAKIVFVSFAANRELLERLPQITHILTLDPGSPWKFLRDTVRVLLGLRRLKPDVSFDLEFFSKFSTLLSLLSGAPERFSYDLPARWRRLTTTRRVPYSHTKHITEVFLDQLPFAAEAGATPLLPQLLPTKDDERLLRRVIGGSHDFVCMNIHAGSTSLERRWEPDRFAAVATRYLEEHAESTVYFTGLAGEAAYVEGLLKGVFESHPSLRGRAESLAGKLSLGGLLALFAQARWFLTNDSGPMHLAAACGTPVIALFGPESPAFYGPRENTSVVYAGISCSPCLNVYSAKYFRCPFQARCMREISVEQVQEAIMRLEHERVHSARAAS